MILLLISWLIGKGLIISQVVVNYSIWPMGELIWILPTYLEKCQSSQLQVTQSHILFVQGYGVRIAIAGRTYFTLLNYGLA